MPRVLVVGGGLLSLAIASRLAQEMAELGTVEVLDTKDLPKAQPDPLLALGNQLRTCAPPPEFSPKLITSSSPGGGAASGYTEFVASRGGKYGASRRRP